MKQYKGYDLNNPERKPIKEAADLSRIAGAEGIVLLKNDDVLPFDKSKTLSVFGRTQIDYVKSGTGSGGLVNTEYSVNIIDALKDRISINQELLQIYTDWLKDNPFDIGHGWATEPWSQKEMPVTDEMCKRASEISDYALVVIGRTAGEDRDNYSDEGSYLLTVTEKELIATVCKHFNRVCVALNTGNIIDMSWVKEYNVPCVLYSWQGGMEGGNAFSDVILGDVSPSGRLTDTVAYDINDYPSTKNHGASETSVFQEDIYVGYRYFETFAKDKVMYPFGYGLSYTDFVYDYTAKLEGNTIKVCANVRNTGEYPSKTVVQVYFEAPQGRLGKPLRQLIRYAKTDIIAVGESQTLTMEFAVDEMASYDDIETYSYILEQGDYKIYVGENVRDAEEVLCVTLNETVTQKLRQALAPIQCFDRFIPEADNGGFKVGYQPTPTRSYDINERIKEHLPKTDAPIADRGISFKDVAEGRNTLDEFTDQLSYKELTCIVKGEGMNSPKVTLGTGGAFGGVTDALLSRGIPLVCVTDGPSGIRMDTGHKATLIPNGTCLACTWNVELVRELHSYMGVELRANDIDILLAPGINIHRNPLNGRNFEYFSEDPYLSGTIAAACTNGLADVGVAGTIKHFACNSQEHNRYTVDSVVSERALREIYLKPFEIAVKQGNATAIMTAYNKLNGCYTAANYDLTTSILRDEWDYKGFVMSDWWTKINNEDSDDRTTLDRMVKAQNDIYMVISSAESHNDNLMQKVNDNELDIAYLRKCAKNLLSFMLTSPALYREPKTTQLADRNDFNEQDKLYNISADTLYDFNDVDAIELEFETTGSALAQYVVNVYEEDRFLCCALTKGTEGEPKTLLIPLPEHTEPIKLSYSSSFGYVNITTLKKKES